MKCGSCSKRSSEKMEAGLSTGNGEKAGYGVVTRKSLDHEENLQVDGALELRDTQRKLSLEVAGIIPSSDLWQAEVGFTASLILEKQKQQTANSESREDARRTQGSSSETQSHILTPLSVPRKLPRTKPPRGKIEFNTPNWGTYCRASVRSSIYGTSNFRKRKQLEDFPPLSPQVSPKTIPSSEETLKPSTTLWNPTLHVDLNIPADLTTPQSPLHTTPLMQRPSSKNTNKLKRRSHSGGTLNPQRRHTRSLSHGAAEKIVRASIFSEDIDPGFQKSTLGISHTFSPGNTLRKTKNAFGRVLASTRLRGWRDCDQVGKIGGFDKVSTPVPNVRAQNVEVTSPQDCYPSPPPSPHPGNRVFISWSTGRAIIGNGVVRGEHSESSTEETGKGKRRALFRKWMRRD